MRDGKIVNWFHWFQDIIVLGGAPWVLHLLSTLISALLLCLSNFTSCQSPSHTTLSASLTRPSPFSEVEPVLEMAVDNLHDVIIHLAFCVHDHGHLVSSPEAQGQTKMSLHRPLESVLGIAASGKCERVDDRALSLLAV